MDKDFLNELLKKYQAGNCTEEERQAIENWYASYDKKEDQLPAQDLSLQQNERMYAGIVDRLQAEGELNQARKLPFIQSKIFRWVAAAIVIFIAGSIYFWPSSAKKELTVANPQESGFKNDIIPGGNKAVLILADGSRLVLDSMQNGKIAQQGMVNVTKLNSGQLAYDKTFKSESEIFYNVLSTPRGGQYELILPDGSKAWLNASSSLRFPTTFSGEERSVELTGEAYFEIAKNAAMPFRVKAADGMTVEVLGTHFNVMSYTNEMAAKTTLLEGLVKVSTPGNASFLKAGEQATIFPGKNSINVAGTDTEGVVAWKNKLFWFHDADIKTVMRQIERWYDVDVIFEDTVLKRFNGSIPMNLTAIKVFNILEMTGGVHFKIDGKKITVFP